MFGLFYFVVMEEYYSLGIPAAVGLPSSRDYACCC